MLRDIVDVKPLPAFRLRLRFEDGVEGVVALAELVDFTGIFAPLQDEAFFDQVRVHPEWGTVFWPNGADLDPDVLYSVVSGESLPVSGSGRVLRDGE